MAPIADWIAPNVQSGMSALAIPLLILVSIWLLYKVTIYALPCLAGLVFAHYALETGAGWFGGLVVFAFGALVIIGLMRWAFASARRPKVRMLLSIAFTAPSIALSYFILNALSASHVPSETWRQVLCIIGALLSGLLAFGRLAEPGAGFERE